jgi:uncharacterized protein (TIGR03437 family)
MPLSPAHGIAGRQRMRAPSSRALHSILALVVSAGLLSPARGQFVQQGTKLVGTGAVGSAQQGISVALSGDGNTCVVGGRDDNGAIGAIWVYTRSGGAWNQQGGKLVGAGAVNGPYSVSQGNSVAVSGDGNTAIVGGPGDNGGTGALWVFTRSGGVWSQQGGKLVGTGAVKATGGYVVYQGSSVALSADGNTAIVGGPGDNGDIGAAWVFTRSGGVWSQQGDKLVGTGAVNGANAAFAAQQGLSVALSGDGNTAIVGGPNDNDFVGAAWVYTRSGGVWSQQGGKLVGTGGIHSTLQGSSVALSGDGNTAIVGGPGAGVVGRSWVYTRSGGAWSQQGDALIGTGDVGGGAMQGSSVALSGDGNTAIVGGPYYSELSNPQGNSFVGAAWVFTQSDGVWSQLGDQLIGTGADLGAYQGSSVALSADGSAAIVGGPIDNGDAGAAWVFVLSASSSGPFIASGGVVDGASFVPGIAPGTWITIQGANLSTTTRIWNSSDFSGNNLPTQLDGVSVTFDGKAAYIYFISPTQLNVLSPVDATKGTVPVQVTAGQGMSNVVDAVESGVSPALFTFSQQGGKYVAAVRADGTYIAPPNLISGLTTVPASPGDSILLFGTGFGPTTPPSPIGQLINPAPLAGQAIVQIGGVAANTQFAGIISPGLYQFNVVVPNVPNGDNSVLIEIGGSFSQPNVFLSVQQ